MPRRYAQDGSPLFNGKRPEEFTAKDTSDLLRKKAPVSEQMKAAKQQAVHEKANRSTTKQPKKAMER